jgi:dGTPase
MGALKYPWLRERDGKRRKKFGAYRSEEPVAIEPRYVRELKLLKELVWHYVILNPNLTTQQHGQTAVVQMLFNTYLEAAEGDLRQLRIFPPRVQEELLGIENLTGDDLSYARIRAVVDLIAGMTEDQAVRLYRRIGGMAFGSVTDTLH